MSAFNGVIDMRKTLKILSLGALLAVPNYPAHAVESQPPAIIDRTAIPDTPAGQAMRIWFEAMNSRDPAKIQAYIERYHRTSSVEDYLGYYKYVGTMSLVRIEGSEPNAISALLAVSNSDDLYRVHVITDPKDKTRLIKIEMSAIDRPDDLAIARLTEVEALLALDGKADELVADDKFTGAMIVARNEAVIYSKAWGLADRSNKIPNQIDTKFRLGSANKMFTAIAILQLAGKGELSLTGKVGYYLPDYPNKQLADKVTIRQILTHTGGTGDIFTEEYLSRISDYQTHSDYIEKLGSRSPQFEPGSAESYSNYGFVLLGAIIEKLSGLSYYQYVDDNIFEPAGMQNSGFLPEDVSVVGRSIGYTELNGALVSNSDSLPYRGTAAGGGYSTVNDMLKFANALQSGKFIPASLLDQASSPQNEGGWYGYGFQTRGKAEMRYFGHSGGAQGMNADFRIYPEVGVVIVALANMDGPYAESLTGFYANRMPSKK
jgi:D-alanyl-D-alanine carboxypeptidase